MSRSSAREGLARALRDAQSIVVNQAAGEPRTLLRMLLEVAPAGLTVICGFAFKGSPLPDLAARDDIRFLCWHPTPLMRPLLESGRARALPDRSSQAPQVFAALRPDLLLTAVASAGARGRSFGASAGHAAAARPSVRALVVEVSEEMPVTFGHGRLPAPALVVESQEPLGRYAGAGSDPVSHAVANRVLSLCDDGIRLQLGIGSVPESLGDLVASGAGPRRLTFCGIGLDCVVEALRRGVADEAARALLISPELVAPAVWRLADRNRAVLVEGAQRAYNPARLASEGRLVSVNSALLVDLLGQVASEGIGPRATGAIGGALDFALAAQLSGGHSVIALPSTFPDGSSRIVSSMPSGTIISIPSHIPDYIVTEFGIAALRGRDRSARARAIASVAHPQHRDVLEAEAAAAG